MFNKFPVSTLKYELESITMTNNTESPITIDIFIKIYYKMKEFLQK